MSKAEEKSKQYKDFRKQCGIKDPVMLGEIEEAYFEGYNQAKKDLIDKTLDFLKDKLYEKGYVGIINLCDDYIKAMKNE